MRIRLFIAMIALTSCAVETMSNDYVTVIQDSVQVDSIKPIVVEEQDSVFEKMSVLIHSTQNAHRKVHQIQLLKEENKDLKIDLVQTREELVKANIEIKKLDSVVNYSKKKTFIQKIVDNFRDTTKTEN